MKYISMILLALIISSCSNKSEGKNDDQIQPRAPYYKVGDIAMLGYKGNIEQIIDTEYDYAEKINGQWISRENNMYGVKIINFNKQGFITEITFDIGMHKLVQPYTEQYTRMTRYTTKRDKDTSYGYIYSYDAFVRDTHTVIVKKPLSDTSYIELTYSIAPKTHKRIFKTKEIVYLRADYGILQTISSTEESSMSGDTSNYTMVADRTDEADLNNLRLVIQTDSIGNPIVEIDRGDPENKRLHIKKYTYYK